MNTLIPIEYYLFVYYHVLLIVALLTWINSKNMLLEGKENAKSKQMIGTFLLFFTTIYMGTRPISEKYFGDMQTYANKFMLYAQGEPVATGKDVYFEYFMKACTYVMSVEFFFLLCAFLYVYPLYLFSRKIFEKYWYYGFLMLLVSMSFWSYGTNGIRNGIGTSVFLYAVSQHKKGVLIALLCLSLMIHSALIIPIFAYVLATFYNKPRFYVLGWFMAIPMSLLFSGFWEGFFLGFGFEEERVEGYLSVEDSQFQALFSSMGFRWDFLLYSATGVFTGWYFIVKKQFNDVFYHRLYSTYVIANAFWILVIEALFSNRFAYMSWFMLGAIIIYPLLKMKFYVKQHELIGTIIVAYFSFTYLLNFIMG